MPVKAICAQHCGVHSSCIRACALTLRAPTCTLVWQLPFLAAGYGVALLSVGLPYSPIELLLLAGALAVVLSAVRGDDGPLL